MGTSETAEVSIVVRVWREPGDPVVRARVLSTADEAQFVGRGRDEILDAVGALLDGVQGTLDLT